MTITTKDIAKLANVSQSTVSRCLNDSPMISEETKKRVLKIAAENNFQFNSNARSLSAKKTSTVGVILPKHLNDDGLDLHFKTWQQKLIESLERMELDVIVTFFENRFTKQNNIVRLIATKKVDGLIILEPNLDNETLLFLENTEIPYVFCKYIPEFFREKDVDFVSVNQMKGGYLATKHLIDLGHKKIMTISGKHDGGEFKLRTEGFKKALYDNNLNFNEKALFFGDTTFKSGYHIIKSNKDILKSITAIFAQNDLMALGAMSALKELGFSIPNDVAVVGFDDIDFCTLYKPYLTTIHQPTDEIAMLTCKRLIEKLDSDEISSSQIYQINPYLVIRESCGGE